MQIRKLTYKQQMSNKQSHKQTVTSQPELLSGKLNQAVRTIRAFKKRIKACQVKMARHLIEDEIEIIAKSTIDKPYLLPEPQSSWVEVGAEHCQRANP